MANQCQRRPQRVAVAETADPAPYAPPQDRDDTLYDTTAASAAAPACLLLLSQIFSKVDE
jgi:hypothetical protein